MTCVVLQNQSGVTFAPHQLATYTTPNFYMGDAAAGLRDSNSIKSPQANHALPGTRSAQALHTANVQNSGAVPAKSSTSHPPLHAEPSFSHGVTFPGKRKWSQDMATDNSVQDQVKSHAQQSYTASPAASQVLIAGMPVQ